MSFLASTAPRHIVAAHNRSAPITSKISHEAQKQKYLVPLAQEKDRRVVAYRAEAGSDAGGTRTTASAWRRVHPQRLKDVHHKRPLRDTCVAMASPTNRKPPRHQRFILEKGMPGFRPGKKENKLGLPPATRRIISPTAAARRQSLGPEGEAFHRQPRDPRRRTHFHRCPRARHARALSTPPQLPPNNATIRKAISEFQAIQFKLQTWPRKSKLRASSFYQPPGTRPKITRFTRESSMAKLFASEVAVRVANECVQIHGGYGFIKDYSRRKVLRDVKLCTIAKAPAKSQKLVIARQLLGKR